MKGSKGITLVALIITIVVLLILAVVAITAIDEGGIIDYARNGRDEYQGAQGNEANTTNGYEKWLYNETHKN